MRTVPALLAKTKAWDGYEDAAASIKAAMKKLAAKINVVMPGMVAGLSVYVNWSPLPGIHVESPPRKNVDGRDKPGHDDRGGKRA